MEDIHQMLDLGSFSDSNWSCNQQHRRSTSCGAHLLGGAEGDYAVGAEEFEQQSSKHGGGRELAALAKTVSRVMLMMGLGTGTAAYMSDDAMQE